MTFLAFGYHTVSNLLNSPYFQIKKVLLLVDKYKNDYNLLKLLDKKQIFYQLLTKEKFSRYSFPKQNQGIVAFVQEYDYVPLNYLLNKKPQREFPFLVMLDRIEDPHNLGAILRTGAALAIDGIIVGQKNQVPMNSTVVKVSVGGAAYVPVCQVSNLEVVINELKKKNYQIVATVCEEKVSVKKRFSFSSPLCLIFGNEHDGIKSTLLKKSDCSLTIPLRNNITSLNVAVSCGIILNQVVSLWDNKN
ncbi:MAG: 23S rRNA (guanosine(2251)-2'-O)-methyltransferase RlmB [Candidatus Moeniiplasma glomeromycotorum]|nr:23S rRNA (guanosine(2251)-2'-O)-methyltransferase RlmB [Candidatus Moeniiplasma glomeromycotorum]MCE8167169.1 23S rRNA (guanosine(2251)-2'-O)-methyltransferase RlmB [Candidatus Moeniiplasma glomeromycotorum]MCE8168819.1 23S rRNA (guanosine(2251)-2'-O)-methyltransferase RlmB [Candidatus Moeniiplasma glomeromycotorum]